MNLTVTSLPDVEPHPREVAVGSFDGVHVGHREVIRGSDTVLTFEPHPLSVIHPEAMPKLIMPFAIKRDVIEGLGVEELLPFLGEVELDPAQARMVRNGVRIPAPGAASGGQGPFRLSCEGRLIAVGRIEEDGRLRTEVVLPVIE